MLIWSGSMSSFSSFLGTIVILIGGITLISQFLEATTTSMVTLLSSYWSYCGSWKWKYEINTRHCVVFTANFEVNQHKIQHFTQFSFLTFNVNVFARIFHSTDFYLLNLNSLWSSQCLMCFYPPKFEIQLLLRNWPPKGIVQIVWYSLVYELPQNRLGWKTVLMKPI